MSESPRRQEIARFNGARIAMDGRDWWSTYTLSLISVCKDRAPFVRALCVFIVIFVVICCSFAVAYIF